MTGPADTPPAETAHAAGTRAARNTLARGGAELIGKLASLVLFAVLARKTGQSGLGAFVFAFAFIQIALVPVDLGYDRWLIRRLARAREDTGLMLHVVTMKLATALPVAAVALLLLNVLGYGEQARETTYALFPGLLFDSFARTVYAVFTAHERSDLLGISLVAQRIATAALGLAMLWTGHGVVAVAGAYSVGAALGLALALALLRPLRVPSWRPPPHAGRRALLAESAPFGVQDVFSVALFRLDALMLSLIATQAAVGRYGAAYRLFEATFFVSISLAGAFAAMYTYLGPDSTPSVQSVLQRSLKLALASLLPIGIACATLADPISRALFGAGVHAGPALRLLSPCIPLLGLVTLAVAFYVSRSDPKPMVWVTGAMALLNVVLNLVLIPPLDDRGAAIAMSATEIAYAAISLVMAARLVTGLDWRATGAGSLVGGAAMAVAALALPGPLAVPLVLSGIVYVAVLFAVERLTSPADVRFALGLVRRWTRPGAPA